MLSKKTIQKNFSRGAKNYNEAALVQKAAAKKLCELVFKWIPSYDGVTDRGFATPSHDGVQKILDLGSGTSFIAKEILKQNQNVIIFEIDLSLEMLESWTERPSNVFPIQGDIENLPFENQSFDVIISSFSLQWVDDLEKTFVKIFSLLKPNGIFAFCVPTSESLQELKAANIFSFNELPKISDLDSAIEKSAFIKKFFETKISKENFKNGLEALKSLKRIGANSSKREKERITKAQLDQFNNFCLKNSHQLNKNSDAFGFNISWTETYFVLIK